jgi:hypothetical protein
VTRVAPGCGSWFSCDRGDCRSVGAARRCPALGTARAPRRGAGKNRCAGLRCAVRLGAGAAHG